MMTYTFSEYGKERLIIYEVNGSTDMKVLMKANKYHMIAITSGEMVIDVNFRIFHLRKHSSLLISSGETIREISTSADMRGYHIIYSPEFQTEMRTTRKSPISLQMKKEYPHQEFTESEFELIKSSIKRIIYYINNPGHLYQSILIKNEFFSMQLNISDKRRKQHGSMMTDNASHQEVIRERFKNLVEGHSDKQHNVSWYANAMFISPDYLSKIIREYDGTSARAWINASIIEKAKFLMLQSDLTLKDISDKLNFPDQSSFGRFFKNNTGQSPKDYRKSLNGEKL